MMIALLKITAIAYLLVQAYEMWNTFKNRGHFTVWQVIKGKLQHCWKCQSFWLVLILTLNTFYAAWASMVVLFIDKLHND